MNTLSKRRRMKAASLTAAAALLAGGLLAVAPVVLIPAHADGPSCIPLDVVNPLAPLPDGARWVDNNASIYVKNNAVFENHEGEGAVVVGGDAKFDTRVGWKMYDLGNGIGGGTGSWPEGGKLMLSVGGKLTVTPNTYLVVGNSARGTWYAGSGYEAAGGDWGPGIFDPGNRVASIAGTVADGLPARMNQFDAAMAAVSSSGTVSADSGHLVLTGDGKSPMQKFVIDYPTYEALFTAPELNIDLSDIPDGSSIILQLQGGDNIKVTGTVNFTFNGEAINAPKPPFTDWKNQDLGSWGNLTQRLLWRFADQDSVQIGLGPDDHSQFTGSLLAAKSGVKLSTYESTNGRVVSMGDFTMHEGYVPPAGQDPNNADRSEFHAFPFQFPGMTCSKAAEGTLSLQKVLAGEPVAFPEGTDFNATATWVDKDGKTQTHEFKLPMSGASQDLGFNLPAGTAVVFSEASPNFTGDWHFPENVQLESAKFDPGFVTIGDSAKQAVTLTNTYKADKPAAGAAQFSLHKVVEGVGLDQFPKGTVFEVTASWTDVDGRDHSALLKLPVTGEPVLGPTDISAGTLVSFSEATPVSPDGYTWQGVTFSPEKITLAADQVTAVKATNTYEAQTEAETGTFSIEKTVVGPTVDEGKVFTFPYTADGEEFTASVAYGQAWTSPAFPTGTKIVIDSDAATASIDGWDLTGVEFAGEGVTVADGKAALTITAGKQPAVEVAATNTYKPATPVAGEAGFSMHKVVEGVGLDKFPKGTVFEVTASWTGADGKQTALLKLPVTGEVVQSPTGIPAGTVVSFSEAKPVSPDGYTWQGVKFSPESITLVADQNISVTASNTYAAHLPVTGANGVGPLAVGGVALLLVGAGLIGYRRFTKA